VFDFLRTCLVGEGPPGASAELAARARQFAMRFQQFTAPVAAKGVEDTAFYRYSRLVSLNEVGGDPATFGLTVRAFHGANADRAARWPHTIIATSTHDNKRSEDVRNRLSVLSELPAQWRLALQRWRAAPQLTRATLNGESAPSAADEYLVYQTVLGILPPADALDEGTLANICERVGQYMIKAAREAKLRTSWFNPDAAYEEALLAFIRSLLGRLRPNPLLSDMLPLAAILTWFGAWNSLSMVLIKFTAPGVPDLYQGNELMDFSLVDPDNRRPVDYTLRERRLSALQSLAARPEEWPARLREMARTPWDGDLKLWLTWRLLGLRQRHAELFRDGAYIPLTVRGPLEDHVIAYLREHGAERVIVLVPRLLARMTGAALTLAIGPSCWGETVIELPAGIEGVHLRNHLTGETITVREHAIGLAKVFALLPLAVLVQTAPPEP